MALLKIIGVPFDGYGRSGNQTGAAAALREAGLAEAWPGHTVTEDVDLDLPSPTAERGESTSLINEPALLAMVDVVGAQVSDAVRNGIFPVVVGGDCTTLLGTIPALRDARVGLLFVDGHEDTTPLDVSEDGEAANAEIGLLLGLTGKLIRGPLAERLPALTRNQLAMLGQRDVDWRQQFNVGSLRDHGVWMRDHHEVAAAPADCAQAAVRHLQTSTGHWWLHTDLDVLDPQVFPAQGLPEVPDEPGGLTWEQLEHTLTTAIMTGGCIGLSVAIYDPEQDPDRVGAQQVVTLMNRLAASLT